MTSVPSSKKAWARTSDIAVERFELTDDYGIYSDGVYIGQMPSLEDAITFAGNLMREDIRRADEAEHR